MSDCPAPARIELRGIRLRRGERQVLDDISLDIAARRIGVVGRNGSGKTTLARVLCGLAQPDAGAVRIGGVDVQSDRRGALQAVGLIFQNPDHQIIFPTVEEEVAFGLAQQGRPRAEARAAARAALAEFGREDWAPRPVATLSQGQRHLVCLISVLAMRPAVIVLDEPFTGLDLPTTRALRRALDALPQTLVQITHQPAALAGYDHLVWLEEGRVAAQGPVAEVLPAFEAAMAREDGDAFADLPG